MPRRRAPAAATADRDPPAGWPGLGAPLPAPPGAEVPRRAESQGRVVDSNPLNRKNEQARRPRKEQVRMKDAIETAREKLGGARTQSVRAVWNDAVLAESERTTIVEGNHYFPPPMTSTGSSSSPATSGRPAPGRARPTTSTSSSTEIATPRPPGATRPPRRRRSRSRTTSPSGAECASRLSETFPAGCRAAGIRACPPPPGAERTGAAAKAAPVVVGVRGGPAAVASCRGRERLNPFRPRAAPTTRLDYSRDQTTSTGADARPGHSDRRALIR